MGTVLSPPRQEVLAELKRRLGSRVSTVDRPAVENAAFAWPTWQPGTIGEVLFDRLGHGGATVAWQTLLPGLNGLRSCAVVDATAETLGPAIAAWGLPIDRLMMIRPPDTQSAWWAVEQCLRSRGIAATCAWVERVPERMLRRWQLAAEAGGSIGLFFRPIEVRREPSWAEFRILVTPQVSTTGETRRVRLEVLYRRGGLGDGAALVEIDHEAGVVQLLSPMAHSVPVPHAAGA